MTAAAITIYGPDGQRLDVSGPNAGRQGIILSAGQVQGLYNAPKSGEWGRFRIERGGRMKGLDQPYRDVSLGFDVFGDDHPRGYVYLDSLLESMFPFELDEWDPEADLARIVVKDKSPRVLRVQQHTERDFDPDFDPIYEEYANPIYRLRAGQPLWESKPAMTVFQSGAESASGFIEVSNPTDSLMFQTWVLTRGTWTIPDVSWVGKKRKRVPGGEFGDRMIPLQPVTSGLKASLDPMELMMADWAGENVLAQVGGGYWLMHEIPPYTPKTLLPISYTGAPAGGARAELHQPRLWDKPWGGE